MIIDSEEHQRKKFFLEIIKSEKSRISRFKTSPLSQFFLQFFLANDIDSFPSCYFPTLILL